MISDQIFCYSIAQTNYTTGVTCGAGTDCPSFRAPEYTPGF